MTKSEKIEIEVHLRESIVKLVMDMLDRNKISDDFQKVSEDSLFFGDSHSFVNLRLELLGFVRALEVLNQRDLLGSD